MQTLPVHVVIPEIEAALQHHNRVILQAPPGAGKTTTVPLALLDAPWLEDQRIIMLEPRRLAARNAAVRMASLLGEQVGERVGYIIRNDRRISTATKITVVTEGILTRMLQNDPELAETALLIFDEFHERNLHADLGLALALQSQEVLRDDLKIMVMSATLDTDALSVLLNKAPVIKSEGRSYPVTHRYLDSKTPHPTPQQLPTLVARTVTQALREITGNILVFLPGVKEIKTTEVKLRELLAPEVRIAPLYGMMQQKEQDAAIAPCAAGDRKVVLATNIAETSLTIEGISIVIDSGLQRISTFDSGSGMNRLHTVVISQDAATQRSGRAGRLGPGICYRLWHEHRTLTRHSAPEILSSDLTPMMLELAAWGVHDPSQLHWLDLPPQVAVAHAHTLLRDLSAMEEERITRHGTVMLQLGTHPRLAHMMLKAKQLNLCGLACLIAALLSEKEIFSGEAKRSSDLYRRVEALVERQSGSGIDAGAMHRALETAKGFQKSLDVPPHRDSVTPESVGVLLAFAYPDRIAKCRNLQQGRYLLSGGKGATLPHDDNLFGEAYLVVADLHTGSGDARIFSAATISQQRIEEHFDQQIITQRHVVWNPTAERVEGRESLQLGAITLEEQPVQATAEERALALLNAIRDTGLEALEWSKEAAHLRRRVSFLNHWKAEDAKIAAIVGDLPDFSDAGLLQQLETWLLPHLCDIKSFKALRRLDTYGMLTGLMTWEERQRIDTLAPEKLKVPSGSNITLNYDTPETPLLSVRLQELFGMLETPRLIQGYVPLTIDLLSPAHRSMQLTQDLNSFWKQGYADVKKDLKGRYPKHYWPDDPFSATATSKTKKQMNPKAT